MSQSTKPTFIPVGDSIINLCQVRRIYYDDKKSEAVILYIQDNITDRIPVDKEGFLSAANKIFSNQFFEI